MSTPFGAIITDLLARLGDAQEQIWSATEAGIHVVNAYQQIANQQGVFYDWVYLENLPGHFSYTALWESTYGYVTFDWGCANYTLDDERILFATAFGGDERQRLGPGGCTCPVEATDGWSADCGASGAIPATADVPKSLTALERVTWDKRGIDAFSPALLQRVDARYQITAGEVYGYLWRHDGVRTLRKVRVPAKVASTCVINGSFGSLRDPGDLSQDPVVGSACLPSRFTHTQGWELAYAWLGGLLADFGIATYTSVDEAALLPNQTGPAWYTSVELADGYLATMSQPHVTQPNLPWGLPRRIPSHHPIGCTTSFGVARRPFLDGTNVRVEHRRQGRPMVNLQDVCELPDRYARYLRDYAQAKLLERAGPGQDLKLSQHFLDRWTRGLARIASRLDRVESMRTSILGGDGQSLINRPPRPSLPWPYGRELR